MTDIPSKQKRVLSAGSNGGAPTCTKVGGSHTGDVFIEIANSVHFGNGNIISENFRRSEALKYMSKFFLTPEKNLIDQLRIFYKILPMN